MTVQELSQLHYLCRAIEMAKDRLLTLEETADVKSPSLSDMPKAPNARDKLGELVPRIADQREEIKQDILRIEEKRREIMEYINSVPNERIRLIMQLRFVDMLSWQDVAQRIGGKETEYSVKHACYRFVEWKNGTNTLQKAR